ncbi:zinc ABC transporter permease AztB [Nocardia crassostreae]|uniref:zinc ABC transporter permease AztB n=1 Tax=Nocardia crassostreae TaxID=53428 RepID=UPI00082D52FA|nr:zinc ABC transporter permease AztB [Nocardia crassostreae]
MEWLITPFEVGFVQRALWGGLLVSCVCAIAGNWVVLRGMAFLWDAMAHGMLPGVAVASLLGGNLLVGAAFSAAAMAWGVSALGRNPRFSPDTSIGLLFVGMLSLGVLIVSRSGSFAVDVTGFLFGDVLAIRPRDLGYLAVAVVLAGVIAVLGHRAFVALAFDARKAQTLGLRPRLAHAALLGLVTLAIVASFHLVGTLLVFGLLIAPPAAAALWADRIPVIMALAAALGCFATVSGLLVSWHAGTAAGASIAVIAVGLFFVSMAASWLRERVRLRGGGVNTVAALAIAAAVLPLAGCGAAAVDDTADELPHGYVPGAEETAEEQPRVVLADKGTGRVQVLDLITEQVAEIGTVAGVEGLARDDRYAFVSDGGRVHIVDGGAWVVDHGDHMHYYRTNPREIGVLARAGVTGVHGDVALTAVQFGSRTALLDRVALDAGTIVEKCVVDGLAVPYSENLVVVRPDSGRAEIRDRDDAAVTLLGESCPVPRGSAVTRRGVVFGCADGALVVSHTDEGFAATKIPYPLQVPDAERATVFTHRPGSTTLVAPAGARGVWVLDIRAKTWTLVESGPAASANTAGEGSVLLVLTRDGVLRGYHPATGVPTGQLPLLPGPVPEGSAPVIEIDTSRAYVNDPQARVVHEIDYRDNLRAARKLPVEGAPTYLVETGR